MLLFAKLMIFSFLEELSEFPVSCSKPHESIFVISRVPERLLLSKYLLGSVQCCVSPLSSIVIHDITQVK
jgi:hypothetical protein